MNLFVNDVFKESGPFLYFYKFKQTLQDDINGVFFSMILWEPT
jgi:hypothetical protein